ncbi:hypothetical protein [Flavobacterium anhuiense]|uniref:hypothetical protein n=1 Tax=Flavobacterium anhuiense TaxID=459526 RepID=UPI003D990BC6
MIRSDSFAKYLGIECRFWEKDNFYVLQTDYREDLLSKGFKRYDDLELKNKVYKEVTFNDIESAYSVSTFCTYKGFKFFVESAFNGKYTLRPLEEAMNHFNDFPKQGYDPVYKAEQNEIEMLWEERKPIENFVFDTESILDVTKNMKKLNSINWIAFKENKIYLENTPITVGINVNDWLEEFNALEYSIEQIIPDENRNYITFSAFPNIVISSLEDIIIDISVYSYQFQSSPYYKGDIFIFEKRLEVPFLSDNIEKYFPDIKVKRPPSRVFNRFSARESVDYFVNERVKIEISIGRSPELVSRISLVYKD